MTKEGREAEGFAGGNHVNGARKDVSARRGLAPQNGIYFDKRLSSSITFLIPASTLHNSAHRRIHHFHVLVLEPESSLIQTDKLVTIIAQVQLATHLFIHIVSIRCINYSLNSISIPPTARQKPASGAYWHAFGILNAP